MAVVKRRSRIVSFRLSPEEYEAMKEQCITEGARSISDYARASACRSARSTEMLRSDPKTEMKIQMLRNRIRHLDREVRRLSQILDDYLAKQAVDGVSVDRQVAHDA